MGNNLDKTTGKIITKIKSKGLANNTIVMFLGDNATNRAIVGPISEGVKITFQKKEHKHRLLLIGLV